MLNSKQRAEYRGKANTIPTTLIVGKNGVTDSVIEDADKQLLAKELVKGRVLEGSLMSAREACDELCSRLGADGVSCLGSRFVLYRFSEKCQEERNNSGRAKRKPLTPAKADPVRKGVRARRMAAKKEKEERNAFFKEIAIEQAKERSRAKQSD